MLSNLTLLIITIVCICIIFVCLYFKKKNIFQSVLELIIIVMFGAIIVINNIACKQ